MSSRNDGILLQRSTTRSGIIIFDGKLYIVNCSTITKKQNKEV